jgi:hypothetical protein
MIHERSGMVRLPAYLQRRSAAGAPMPMRNLDETDGERGEVGTDRSSHAHTEISEAVSFVCNELNAELYKELLHGL